MQGRLPRGSRAVAALIAIVGALLAPQAAGAAIDSVFGGDVSCTAQSDGVRFCGSSSPRSTTKPSTASRSTSTSPSRPRRLPAPTATTR